MIRNGSRRCGNAIRAFLGSLYRRFVARSRAGFEVSDQVLEFVDVDVSFVEGTVVLLIDAGVVLKGRFVRIQVKDAEGERVFLEGFFEGLHPIGWIVGFIEIIRVLFEPLIGVDLVVCDAGLEDVEEGVALVRDGFFHQVFGLLAVLGVGSCDEASVQGDGDGQWIEGL